MIYVDWVQAIAETVYSGGVDLITQPFYPQATWPAAIYHSGSDKTYFAWETETRPNSIKVAEYDHSAGSISQIVTVDSHALIDDSHGSPALEILSDGRIVCFYGAHNDDLQWSISDQSGGDPDISNWTRQTALSAASYTYPKPVNIDSGGGAGTIYLIARHYNGSGHPLILQSASYTSGGAVSFGSVTTLYDRGTSRVYAAEFYLDGSNNIEIACTNSDNTDTSRRHVHFLRYMTATGAVENFDGATSTASGSLPINTTLADSDYRLKNSGSNEVGFVSFCRDSNGYAHLLYGDGSSDPIDVKHTYHNGVSWSSEETLFTARDAGATFGSAAGAATTTWALVPAASGAVHVYYGDGNTGTYSTSATDTIKRRVWNGTTWAAATEFLSAGDDPFGPMTAVRNADPDFRVFISESSDSAIDISAARLNKYLYGDSGFIEWNLPANDADYYQLALLLNFNGSDAATSTSDESSWSHLHPVTFNGNAQLDTAQQKFGSASLLLDGSSYLTIPPSRENQITAGHEFRVDGYDTVGLWVRPNETGRLQAILTTKENDGDNYGFMLYQDATEHIVCSFYPGVSGSVMTLTSTTTVSTGTWYFIAIQQTTGDNINLIINGSTEDNGSLAATTGGLDEGSTLNIGRDPVVAGRGYNGWIDSVWWFKKTLKDVSTSPTSEITPG